MERPKRKCPNCGRRMKQQFNGLFHCKCGISYSKVEGYFERTPDMVFCLKHNSGDKKPRRLIQIRRKDAGES